MPDTRPWRCWEVFRRLARLFCVRRKPFGRCGRVLLSAVSRMFAGLVPCWSGMGGVGSGALALHSSITLVGVVLRLWVVRDGLRWRVGTGSWIRLCFSGSSWPRGTSQWCGEAYLHGGANWLGPSIGWRCAPRCGTRERWFCRADKKASRPSP